MKSLQNKSSVRLGFLSVSFLFIIKAPETIDRSEQAFEKFSVNVNRLEQMTNVHVQLILSQNCSPVPFSTKIQLTFQERRDGFLQGLVSLLSVKIKSSQHCETFCLISVNYTLGNTGTNQGAEREETLQSHASLFMSN